MKKLQCNDLLGKRVIRKICIEDGIRMREGEHGLVIKSEGHVITVKWDNLKEGRLLSCGVSLEA